MRLWTVHPRYLDAQGLVALWRESLLAQKVLRNETRGYRHHPQLERFRAAHRPLAAIARYLSAVLEEAQQRGYRFDESKIGEDCRSCTIAETDGQLLYEWEHLQRKLLVRRPELYERYRTILVPTAHPLFTIVSGGIRAWERTP